MSTTYYGVTASGPIANYVTTNESEASSWTTYYGISHIRRTIRSTFSVNYDIYYKNTSTNIYQYPEIGSGQIETTILYTSSGTQTSGTYAGFELGYNITTYNKVTFTLLNYSLEGYNTLKWNTKSDLTGTNYDMGGSYTTKTSVYFYLKKIH